MVSGRRRVRLAAHPVMRPRGERLPAASGFWTSAGAVLSSSPSTTPHFTWHRRGTPMNPNPPPPDLVLDVYLDGRFVRSIRLDPVTFAGDGAPVAPTGGDGTDVPRVGPA